MKDKGVLHKQMEPFLHPKGIAVIGASSHPEKLGYGVLKNLLHPEWGFPGPVYPVNPKAREILGQRCYAHVSEVPDPVDLAVILIPAPLVPQTVEDCGKRGIKGVIVVSGGFQELGPDGEQLQQKLVRVASDYHLRIMGPNGIGIIDTTIPLNTTFVRNMPLRGRIALISQSGALCGAAIDWARPRGIGFSRIYSVGNQADLVETDFLEVLADDPETNVICLYVEEISDGVHFYHLARNVVQQKPVLFLKAGRTHAGKEAAKSHTGALAGEATAYHAACHDAGVHWCTSLQDMLEGAKALADASPLRGKRVAVVTNAGGPAALAADALAENGFELARVTTETGRRLREILPAAAQVHAVVDMLGAAGPKEYAATIQLVAQDSHVDGILVIHVPQATVDPLGIVQNIETRYSSIRHKPLLLVLPGQEGVSKALAAANRSWIPAVTFAEDGARALKHLMYRTKALEAVEPSPKRPPIVPAARTYRFPRTRVLTDWDMRPILEHYGIPLVRAAIASDAQEAARKAEIIGFPVVLKVISPDVLHKSDVGAVVVNLRSREEVLRVANRLLKINPTKRNKKPYLEIQQFIPQGIEAILGIKRDSKFGPIVMFGLGGIWVEIIQKVAFGLAPLTKTQAYSLLERSGAIKLLSGGRGRPPADIDALVDTMMKISWLAVDWPELMEMDINPLFVLQQGQGVVAVDTRAVTKQPESS